MSSNFRTLSGNLTRDAEHFHNPERDTRVTKLRIAHTLQRRDNHPAGAPDPVIYIDVILFKGLAHRARFLKRGQGVTVSGNSSMDVWIDKQTGEVRTKENILANTCDLTTPLPSSAQIGQIESGMDGGGDEEAPPARPAAKAEEEHGDAFEPPAPASEAPKKRRAAKRELVPAGGGDGPGY